LKKADGVSNRRSAEIEACFKGRETNKKGPEKAFFFLANESC